jgi:hypothetical protein
MSKANLEKQASQTTPGAPREHKLQQDKMHAKLQDQLLSQRRVGDCGSIPHRQQVGSLSKRRDGWDTLILQRGTEADEAQHDTKQHAIPPRMSYSITTSPLKPCGSSGPHTRRRPLAALSCCHSTGTVSGPGVSAGPIAAATPTPASPRHLPLAHAHAHARTHTDAQANAHAPTRGSAVALEAAACANSGGAAGDGGGGAGVAPQHHSSCDSSDSSAIHTPRRPGIALSHVSSAILDIHTPRRPAIALSHVPVHLRVREREREHRRGVVGGDSNSWRENCYSRDPWTGS